MSTEQSEFNYAISFLNRLNVNFYQLAEAKQNLDIYAWCNTLVTLFCEMSDDIDKKDMSAQKEKLKQIYSKVNQEVHNFNSFGKLEVSPKIYWELINFELYLRDVIKKAGYKSKYKDKAGEALR